MIPKSLYAAVRDETAVALTTPMTPSFLVQEIAPDWTAFDLAALAARMQASPIIARIPTRVATADERHLLKVVALHDGLQTTGWCFGSRWTGFETEEQAHFTASLLYQFQLVEERWALLADPQKATDAARAARMAPGLLAQARDSGKVTPMDTPFQPEMAERLAQMVGPDAILILHPDLAEWLTAHGALPDDRFCFTHDEWPEDTLVAVDLSSCLWLTGETPCVGWRWESTDKLRLHVVINGERALLCPHKAVAGLSGITRKVW